MHFKNTLLATQGLLLTSQVLAAPQDILARLMSRQDNWDYVDDEDGNTRIRVSDNTINFGAIGIDDVVQNIKNECTDVSCGGSGTEYEVDTKLVVDWNQYGRTVKVHADGSFASESPGTRDDLVDMAERVLEEFVESERKAHTDWFGCYQTNSCESHANNHGEEATEYWWPDEMHIRVDTDDGAIAGTLDLTFSVESADHSGLCSELTSFGGAVAGAVGAPTASLFSLFALGCS